MSDRGRGQSAAPEPAGLKRGAPPPRGSAARPAQMPEPYRYTIGDLEQRTGLSARTIRYYIQEGLLPPAHGRGPTATYDLSHLLRLQAITQLKANHLPLGEIRDRLAGLTDKDIAALLEVNVEPAQDDGLWRRIELHPDLELLVRERPGRERDYKFRSVVEMVKMLVRDELQDSDQDPARERR